MSNEDQETPGDRRQLPRAPRRGSAFGPVGDMLTFSTGFAVVLGCRFRSKAASLAEPPQASYPGVRCGFPGGPGICVPAECPLVGLASERLKAHLQDQAIRGVGAAAVDWVKRLFSKGPEAPGDQADNDGGR